MQELEQLLRAFNHLADVNQWHGKHSPKNLSMAIAVEAAELLELFQWREYDEDLDENLRRQAGHEMADVLLYLLSLAEKLNIDLLGAAREKMQINQLRFARLSE